jgi:hypothetical protein
VSAADSSAARAEEGFWVAVLPFKDSGGNADLTALAKGLAEDTVTGLSRFSYLRVISRSSTAHYANESADVCAAGKRTRCPLCDGRQPAPGRNKAPLVPPSYEEGRRRDDTTGCREMALLRFSSGSRSFSVGHFWVG